MSCRCGSHLQHAACLSRTKHLNTVETCAVHPQFCEFHWSHSMFPTLLSVWKVDKLLNSHKAKTATTHTLKTHNLSCTATKLVSCREHSISGKGVIFTAVSTVQSQPTWQSVSLLIGLILGGLLQDFIVGIIIYVTDVTVYCAASYTKAFPLLYMLP